jgi:hypothetical protein
MTAPARTPATLLLPDEVIETARQLIDEQDGRQWELGDYLNEVVGEFEVHFAAQFDRRGAELAARRARTEIIRQIAGRTGADTSTLRDRQCMAAFYPAAVRAEYPFSWSQWRALKSAGDEWRRYADWAADNLPAPAALIRAKIRGGGHLAPAWEGRWERAKILLELLEQDEGAPEALRGAAWRALAELTHADPLGSEADPLGSEADPLGSEADPLGSEADPLGSEADPLGSEAEGGAEQPHAEGQGEQDDINQHVIADHGQQALAETRAGEAGLHRVDLGFELVDFQAQ